MLNIVKEKIQSRINAYFYYHFMPHVQKLVIQNSRYECDNTKGCKKNKVVYTCLTGNYDTLPLHEYIDTMYDYMCFTDNPNLLRCGWYGAWQIKPLVFAELNNQLNNRWHKTHPHVLFPDYDESIYIDSNVCILTNYLFEVISQRQESLIIPKHYKNDCIYAEVVDVKKYRLADAESIQKMMAILHENNFPKHYGLNENNIIYRKHNDKKIVKVMEEWWHFIKDITKRDQLSLAYVLWKNGISPDDIAIPNARTDDKNFFIYGHKK